MHKNLLFCALLGAMIAVSAGPTASFLHENKSHQVEMPALTERRAARPRLNDLNDAVEIEKEKMSAYITSVTSTSASTAVTVQLTSVSLVGYGNSLKTMYMIIDDENFTGDLSEPFKEKGDDLSFNGYMISIKNVTGNNSRYKNITIPHYFSYAFSDTEDFYVYNRYIESGAIDFDTIEEGKLNIETITIPAYIEEIHFGAFVNVPDSVKIICEAEEKPLGWDDDWTDATNIEWGADLSDLKNEEGEYEYKNNITFYKYGGATQVFGEAGRYMCGYINEDGAFPDFANGNYPLIVSYETKLNGAVKESVVELPLIEKTNRSMPYDAVGSIGSPTIPISFEIDLEEGEEVDYDSFTFYNIYEAVRDTETKKYSCDTTIQYKIHAVKRFSREIVLEHIIDYRFESVKEFAGYTLITMKFDKVTPNFYLETFDSVVEFNKDKIDNGDYVVRYAFYNLNNADIDVYYLKDGAMESFTEPIKTPSSVLPIDHEKGNRLSVIVPNNDVGAGFKSTQIRGFQLVNLTFNMHLWNTKSNVKVGRTEYSFSFGRVNVLTPHEDIKPNIINLDLVMILIYVAYIVIYAGVTAGLFFYLKEKYKNDEFRRMKPKQFFKTAIIGFVGLAVVVLAITAIIYRFGVFANTIAAFNPSDIFVVLAGIVSVVIIGYFIKFFAGLIKANKERRKIIKLRLTEVNSDDGTK